jgi:hypothetical protein
MICCTDRALRSCLACVDARCMSSHNPDNPATPTSQLPAARKRLYGNLRLPGERDPFSVLFVTG